VAFKKNLIRTTFREGRKQKKKDRPRKKERVKGSTTELIIGNQIFLNLSGRSKNMSSKYGAGIQPENLSACWKIPRKKNTLGQKIFSTKAANGEGGQGLE